MKAQAAVTILRDILSMGAGILIAVHEEITGNVHPELLALSATLLGVPSIVHLLLPTKAGRQETPPTPEPSAPSQSSGP